MFVKVVRMARDGTGGWVRRSAGWRGESKCCCTRLATPRRRTTRAGADRSGEHKPKGGQPYKRAYGEPKDKAQSTFTNPDRSIMKTSAAGFQPCDNAQVAVDGEPPLLVATELTSNASDQGVMVGLLDAVKGQFDAQPERGLADAGDGNECDLLELEARGIDGYVAPRREGKKVTDKDAETPPATHRMVEKLATPAGRGRYAQRKWLSEAPNGWIKEVPGFRRFSVRSLNKARGEWDLVWLVLNIKRLQPLLAV